MSVPQSISDSSHVPVPSTDSIRSEFDDLTNRRVLMGTCGWTDDSIGKCGRFYPQNIRTASERLRHYSAHFPCVEVDTSNYAIPHADRLMDWCAQTPVTFKFHFKIFGIFTMGSIVTNAIPSSLRHLLTPKQQSSERVRLKDTTDAFKSALWSLWNQNLRHVYEAGKLGLIVFQFHLGFVPSKENKEYIEWCRSQLDPAFEMAIEFRSRSWFQRPKDDPNPLTNDEYYISKTVRFARRNGLVLVAEDDLAHEVVSRFEALPIGQTPKHLPIVLRVAAPSSLYIRMHRRQGNKRVLAPWEFRDWARRFQQSRDEICHASTDGSPQPQLEGPIWYLIGTDHEDQPVINSKLMLEELKKFDGMSVAERDAEYPRPSYVPAQGPTAVVASSPPAAAAAAASSSSSAAASSSSSATPTSSCTASSSTEPLAFDYLKYFKQVLAKLPSTHVTTSSTQQLSLGSFFSKPGTQAAANSKPHPLLPPSHAHPNTSAAAIDSATFDSTLSSPSSSQTDNHSVAFVRASSLPTSPPPTAKPKPNFFQSSAAAAAVAVTASSTSSSTSATTAPSSNAAPAVMTDDDVAAQVAAIERKYQELENGSSSTSASATNNNHNNQNVHASPAKRKDPPGKSVASPSPSKKAKSNVKKSGAVDPAATGSKSITAFFQKK